MSIYLYNSLTKKKEKFIPIDATTIKMYVCGPTVYDYPHIGNARSVIIYDILYRLLISQYGLQNIIYVRNITDIDDKIIIAAKEKNISINVLTTKFTEIYSSNMKALGCLSPTITPKATDHINDMIQIIEALIKTNYAYVTNGHVYFSIESDLNYGLLAGREINEMIAGARIEVVSEKKHPGDFVLWKPADEDEEPSSSFASPWGTGRPGWHIECSAMSYKYLGENFDIHGGGADLIFPHHTNEIAQSCCAFKGSKYAKYWVHNGFLTVDGEKMSKSLGNFITTQQLLDQQIDGEIIRYVLLSSHYRKPMDFTDKALADAKKSLNSFYRCLELFYIEENNYSDEVIAALKDDLNTPLALSILHQIVNDFNKSEDINIKKSLCAKLKSSANLIGLLVSSPKIWFRNSKNEDIDIKVQNRTSAKLNKNWQLADQIRDELKQQGIILEDNPDGTTTWRNQ